MDIVMIADRPDLVPTVASWLWGEFWRYDGFALEETAAAVSAATARLGPPQTFVLLEGGTPVGTASLATDDLDERPDLTPWLAGVFVIPAARGLGYATRLIGAVEAACKSASIPSAWLYTNTAERLYERAGWRTMQAVARQAKPTVMLMRKDFAI